MGYSLCRALRVTLALQALSLVAASSPFGSSNSGSFLTDNLVRKDQVQSVLEHQPAQEICENAVVRPPAPDHIRPEYTDDRSAYRSDRDDAMRLRDR